MRSAGRRPSTERVSTWRSGPLGTRNVVIQSAFVGLRGWQARHARGMASEAQSCRAASAPSPRPPARALTSAVRPGLHWSAPQATALYSRWPPAAAPTCAGPLAYAPSALLGSVVIHHAGQISRL